MSGSGNTIVLVTFAVAFLLAIFPLPAGVAWARPEWIAMVLIYWTIAWPERIGLWTAFLAGLLFDGIAGNLIGQNALALSLISWAVLQTYQRLRMFAAWQQAFFVFVLIGVHQLVIHWSLSWQGLAAPTLKFLLPAATSALIWPWLMIFLRGLRRRSGLLRTM